MTDTRVVVAARLSRVQNGEAGRIDRDDIEAQRWAEARGDVEIVGISEDAGVSGSVSPFDRPALKPWLDEKGPLIHSYDEVVASTLDRLGRSAGDLQDLRKWADRNGKTLRVLKPDLTWPAPDGTAGIPSKIMWELLGILAEAELEATKERYAAARADLIGRGSFVGKPPWGYVIVGDKFHKSLAPHPKLAPYLRKMAVLATRGDTYIDIARWLDSQAVPARNGGKWAPTSVRNVLMNPALMGRRYENGEVVAKFDSILTASQFATLQTAIGNRPGKRGPSGDDTAMLRNIIFCEKCEGPMYRHHTKTKRKDGTHSLYTVYRCNGTDTARSKCANAIRLADAEAFVNAWFTEDGAFADVEIVETVPVPGNDHSEEIAEIDRDIRDLNPGAADFLEQIATLHAERARLLALPSEPAQVVKRPTGRTVGNVWASLNDAQRRRFMLSAGLKVYCLSNATLRARDDGRRQNPTGPAIMLRDRMGQIPRPGQSSAATTPAVLDIAPDRVPVPAPAWGSGEPVARETLYVVGDPSTIEGALSNLTESDDDQ
jgi:site-specific DNA recombinase